MHQRNLSGQDTPEKEERMRFSGDIVELLKDEGYEVIEGADAVREAIRRSGMGEGVYE